MIEEDAQQVIDIAKGIYLIYGREHKEELAVIIADLKQQEGFNLESFAQGYTLGVGMAKSGKDETESAQKTFCLMHMLFEMLESTK